MTINELAQKVLDVCESGSYTTESGKTVSVERAIEKSKSGTVLYSPESVQELRAIATEGAPFEVSVIDGTTQTVSAELAKEGPVCVLNFASARNPGGGFLGGAKAQEEDLCRCSSLFVSIEPQQEYYETNRDQNSMLYTDYMIYSPDVVFFKTRGSGDFLEEPFFASVITAPAPNTRPFLKRGGDPEALRECFLRRWENVLAVAEKHGVKTLILGAWGCGAFGGDPTMSAETAQAAIEKIGGSFHRVVFAIPGKGKVSSKNLEAFRTILFS